MTTASPMTVMMPKGRRTTPIPAPSTDAIGSCVEFRPVSLVLDVTFSVWVGGSTEVLRTGMKVVRGRAGNGLSV